MGQLSRVRAGAAVEAGPPVPPAEWFGVVQQNQRRG
jgi:hypothetical protein